MNRYMATLIALICTSAPIMGFGSDTSDAARGQTHYSTCQTCHGVNAEGNQAVGAPRLVGLQEWYLVKQMQKYRTGLRGSEAQDTFGQQMAAMAKSLDDNVGLLLAYLKSAGLDENTLVVFTSDNGGYKTTNNLLSAGEFALGT